jgi:multicomponent Na+:H+ antiporter subunit E
MYRLQTIILLTVFYLGLTSNLEILNILMGVLIAVGVAFLLGGESRPLNWQRVPSMLFALLKYVAILVYDLFKSGFQVARIVLSRDMAIKPGILALSSDCESEPGAALSAHALTLTPGELVIEMDEDGILYTHCLDATRSAKYAQDAQRMRHDLLDKIIE